LKTNVKTSPHGSSVLTISIADGGNGINQTEVSKLFKPFCVSKQFESSLLQQVGVGLGLYTARKIARQIGGDIKLISNRVGGKGCSFKISLLVQDHFNVNERAG